MIDVAQISVVVPTYNERENVHELVDRLEATGLNLQIIIVDDNSPDNTAAEVRKLAVEHGNITLIERPGKLGLASAVSQGIEKSSGTYVAVMDADLQHPPEKLLEIYRCLEDGADLVVASRYTSGGAVEGWSFYRRLMSHGATFLAHLLLPETRLVSDPMSGFFAFKRESMKDIKISTRSYKILLELLHQMRNRDWKTVEVPFVFAARKRGASKLASGEIIRYIDLLLELTEYRITKYLIIALTGILATIVFYHFFLRTT
jgi:dolichol-phosphate mannosyltransferase